MKTHKCPKCGITKSLDLFYKDKRHGTGYRRWCKECCLGWNRSEVGKSVIRIAMRKCVKKYPEKWEARAKLNQAVEKGEIIKPDKCEMDKVVDSIAYCKGRIEGHHVLGYEGENWKHVLWLCRTHHREYHTIFD